jgi:hypothetical protein
MSARTTAFDRGQLLTELAEFRKAFRQRSFWSRPAAVRQLAVTGLTVVYLNSEPDQTAAELVKAALTEYGRREWYLMVDKKR